jgi:Spy/CpxP family protein refolding chaperone
MANRLIEELNLNEEQGEQVKDIMSSAHEACRDAENKRECMKSQKDEIHQQISALLNDEQQAAFSEITSLIDQIGHRGYAMYSKLKEQSDVTDQQLAAVKEVFSQAKASCEGASDKSEMRECRRSQRDTVRAELESILGEELLEALRPPRPPRDF